MSRAVTIDFNGKTLGIVLESVEREDGVDSGKLVLCDSGNNGTAYSIDTTGTDTSAAVSVTEDATVTIESGRYTGIDPVIMKQTTKTGGGVIINGGTFVDVDAGDVVTNGDGTMIIHGGTFNVDPSGHVANGYEAVKNDSAGTWTVTAK